MRYKLYNNISNTDSCYNNNNKESIKRERKREVEIVSSKESLWHMPSYLQSELNVASFRIFI